MVAVSAIQTPIPKPAGGAAFVDSEGNLSNYGLTLLADWHSRLVGTARLIPCNATGTNVITLTPLSPSPLIEKYDAFDTFVFVAANTSTGVVTATVVPKKGSLDTIKAYKDSGATQAGTGDVVAGSLYMAVYNDALDSAAGGLVLK